MTRALGPAPWFEASTFTVEERLDACLEIADRIEHGTNTPIDDLTLIAHLKVLRESANSQPGSGA